MKKTKTFSVDEAIYESFDKVADEKFLNKSQWIESKIQEYVEYNVFKDTFGANEVLGNICTKIEELIDEDDYIQEQLAKVSDKSNLVVSLKMESNFYRIEIKLEPKYPFDANKVYMSEIDDDEKVSIVDSTLNYIILSNGNKLRVKDFQKLYSPVIDPEKFLSGKMTLEDMKTDITKDKTKEIKDSIAEHFINQCKEKEDAHRTSEEDNSSIEHVDHMLGKIKPEDFFKKGNEELLGMATDLLKLDINKYKYPVEVESRVTEYTPVDIDENIRTDVIGDLKQACRIKGWDVDHQPTIGKLKNTEIFNQKINQKTDNMRIYEKSSKIETDRISHIESVGSDQNKLQKSRDDFQKAKDNVRAAINTEFPKNITEEERNNILNNILYDIKGPKETN